MHEAATFVGGGVGVRGEGVGKGKEVRGEGGTHAHSAAMANPSAISQWPYSGGE